MPAPSTPPAACVFDLDGTLVDSLRDIGESVNECLELLGIGPIVLERYRYLVGEGIPLLCRRAIGDAHPHLVERLIELARPRYRTRLLRHTRPYAGVNELIGRLCRADIKLGVLSNKPHDMTGRIVRAFWPTEFQEVWGYVEEAGRKPDPTRLLSICARFGVSPRETWLIGDTPTDIETARRAGVVGVGVTWGFRTDADLREAGAAWIVDVPAELAIGD
ncbi:Phosphoglycolate phosphatase [Phycisphaerae bacterium RAS1]|nr:Phosphoglycolate phosphatase [Phycisphaerae bacterium RAS1]